MPAASPPSGLSTAPQTKPDDQFAEHLAQAANGVATGPEPPPGEGAGATPRKNAIEKPNASSLSLDLEASNPEVTAAIVAAVPVSSQAGVANASSAKPSSSAKSQSTSKASAATDPTSVSVQQAMAAAVVAAQQPVVVPEAITAVSSHADSSSTEAVVASKLTTSTTAANVVTPGDEQEQDESVQVGSNGRTVAKDQAESQTVAQANSNSASSNPRSEASQVAAQSVPSPSAPMTQAANGNSVTKQATVVVEPKIAPKTQSTSNPTAVTTNASTSAASANAAKADSVAGDSARALGTDGSSASQPQPQVTVQSGNGQVSLADMKAQNPHIVAAQAIASQAAKQVAGVEPDDDDGGPDQSAPVNPNVQVAAAKSGQETPIKQPAQHASNKATSSDESNQDDSSAKTVGGTQSDDSGAEHHSDSEKHGSSQSGNEAKSTATSAESVAAGSTTQISANTATTTANSTSTSSSTSSAVTGTSAANPVQAVGPTTVDRAHVVQQVANQIEVMTAARPKDGVVVHLEPQNLGTVTLVVKTVQQGIDAQIYASNDHVRDALDQSRSELGQALAVKGFNLNSVSVSASNSSSGTGLGNSNTGMNQGSQSPWQGSQSQGQRSQPSNSSSNFGSNQSNATSQSTVSRKSLTGLDVWI